MKSNTIKISSGSNNISDILAEVQASAFYTGLAGKNALRLRLLAEELIGMLKGLSGNFTGEFWVEQAGLNYQLITHISVRESMSNESKRSFIDVSSTKTNAAAKGIMGKIRDVVENMMYPESTAYRIKNIEHNLDADLMLSDNWSLSQYKDSCRASAEPWDEIEKSIVANLADDVSVSVKGHFVKIVISKNFS